MDKFLDELHHSELCDIMNRHGSDKGSGHHNYTKFYDQLFRDIKDKNMNILEIGIGTMNPNMPSSMCGLYRPGTYLPGASLRGWREYFSNSKIYGCDIDRDVLINSDRIETFYMDQINMNDSYFKDAGLDHIMFDIIIDDGLHNFAVNFNVMQQLFKRLKDNGIYIIEDICDYASNMGDNEFLQNIVKYGYSWEYIKIPNPGNAIDNNLFVIKRRN